MRSTPIPRDRWAKMDLFSIEVQFYFHGIPQTFAEFFKTSASFNVLEFLQSFQKQILYVFCGDFLVLGTSNPLTGDSKTVFIFLTNSYIFRGIRPQSLAIPEVKF